VGGAGERLSHPTHRKLSFPVQISETVVQIHANDVLNIGVEKFGKLGMGGAGQMYVTNN